MNRRDLRAAYVELCRGIDVQYLVTLATNRDGTINGAQKLAKDYCGRIDRKLLVQPCAGSIFWKQLDCVSL